MASKGWSPHSAALKRRQRKSSGDASNFLGALGGLELTGSEDEIDFMKMLKEEDNKPLRKGKRSGGATSGGGDDNRPLRRAPPRTKSGDGPARRRRPPARTKSGGDVSIPKLDLSSVLASNSKAGQPDGDEMASDLAQFIKGERVREWAQTFRRSDPRYQILNVFNDSAQKKIQYMDQRATDHSVSPLLRAFYKASVFTVWRPVRYAAIRRMILGEGIGKGPDIKGRPARKGKLDGFVPFLQIHKEEHKADIRIRTLPKDGKIRIFYHSNEDREQVVNFLESVATEMVNTVKKARAIVENDSIEDDDLKEWAFNKLTWDMADSRIHAIDDHVPNKFGIEVAERLFWEGLVIRQVILRETGSPDDTGLSSEPNFQNMNFAALRPTNENAKPQAVILQYKDSNDRSPQDPMDPRNLLMAYEEDNRVMPVVAAFDCFLMGTRGVRYDQPLPQDQVEVSKWCVNQIESTLEDDESSSASSWSSRWLDMLKNETAKGFHPTIPPLGFSDPKSLSIMKKAIHQLRKEGSVRHGAECFNYYFPQELDGEYLVISDRLPGTSLSWKYVDQRGLQEILMEKIDQGYTFPINPKWVLCDPGWKDVLDKLVSSKADHVQDSLKAWYPPESGLLERMEGICKRFPNGFEQRVARSSLDKGTEGMDLAELELKHFMTLQRAKRKLRSRLVWRRLLRERMKQKSPVGVLQKTLRSKSLNDDLVENRADTGLLDLEARRRERQQSRMKTLDARATDLKERLRVRREARAAERAISASSAQSKVVEEEELQPAVEKSEQFPLLRSRSPVKQRSLSPTKKLRQNKKLLEAGGGIAPLNRSRRSLVEFSETEPKVIEAPPMDNDEWIDDMFYREDEIGEMRHTAFMIQCGVEEDPPDGPDVPPIPWKPEDLKKVAEEAAKKEKEEGQHAPPPTTPKSGPLLDTSQITGQEPSLAPPTPITNILHATVIVALFDGESRKVVRCGSGFIADKQRGLIVTASHILMNIRGDKSAPFGEDYDGLRDGKALIGFIPKSEDAESSTEAVFRYFAEIASKDPNIEKGICHLDACVLRITARMERDVSTKIEECAELSERQLLGENWAMKQERLTQLRLANGCEMEEQVRIFGYNQGDQDSVEAGETINRYVDFSRGYVCSKFTAAKGNDEIVVLCPTIGGHSGGPCVNQKGEVIGILSRVNPADKRCHLVPTSEWKALLKQAKNIRPDAAVKARTRELSGGLVREDSVDECKDDANRDSTRTESLTALDWRAVVDLIPFGAAGGTTVSQSYNLPRNGRTHDVTVGLQRQVELLEASIAQNDDTELFSIMRKFREHNEEGVERLNDTRNAAFTLGRVERSLPWDDIDEFVPSVRDTTALAASETSGKEETEFDNVDERDASVVGDIEDDEESWRVSTSFSNLARGASSVFVSALRLCCCKQRCCGPHTSQATGVEASELPNEAADLNRSASPESHPLCISDDAVPLSLEKPKTPLTQIDQSTEAKVNGKVSTRQIPPSTNEDLSYDANLPGQIDTILEKASAKSSNRPKLRAESLLFLSTLQKYLDCREKMDARYREVDKSQALASHAFKADVLDMVARTDPWLFNSEYQQQSIHKEPVKTMDELYEAAKQVFPICKEIVENLTRNLRAKHADEAVDMTVDVCKELKEPKRAKEKAEDDYAKRKPKPAFSWLYDIVRGSVEFGSAELVAEFLDGFLDLAQAEQNITIIKAKNRFKQPSLTGYRDLNIQFKIHSLQGFYHICELQIHLKAMRRLDKELRTHMFYKFFRSYFAGATSALEERLAVLKLISDGGAIDDSFVSKLLQTDTDTERLERLGVLIRDQLCEYQCAFRVFVRLLEINRSQYGIEHPNVARAYRDIALVLKELGELAAAMVLHKGSLKIYMDTYGDQHSAVSNTYFNMALLLREQGHLEQSMDLFQKSLDIDKRNLGEQSLSVADTYNCVGTVLRQQGKLDEALDMFKKSLQIKTRLLRDDDWSIADTLQNLATTLKRKGVLEYSEVLFRASIDIARKSMGENHVSIAAAYRNLALLLEKRGNYVDALVAYDHALDVYRTNFGETNRLVADIYNDMACLYHDEGDLVKAKSLVLKSWNIKKKLLAESEMVFAEVNRHCEAHNFPTCCIRREMNA